MPSGLSEVDIINGALIDLGEQPIASRTEQNKRGRTMNSLFDGARDELLRECPWNFAKTRVTIAADPVAPTYGFTTKFLLPSDFIKMLSAEGFTTYVLEGGFLLTNITTSIKIRYIARVTDPTQFDTIFPQALRKLLAIQAATRLADDPQLTAKLRDEYRLKLTEARKFNGVENDPIPMLPDELELVRNAGSIGFGRSGGPFIC